MTDSVGPSCLDLIDGLRRFQKDFERDFYLRDIVPGLQNIITRSDLMEITKLSDEKLKIEKLFFTFIYVKKDVWPLVALLQKPYRWLYDNIIKSKSDKWISDYRQAIRDIPNNHDWNIHRTKYLWDIQTHLKALQQGDYLILFGKLGFGKRWLAADACRDYGVISHMNFKIYWLNVSKCCTQELVLEKMHRLKVLLQADDLDIKYSTYSGNTKNEIIHMRTYLRKILEQPEFKKCLIVLTDVQDENITKAFDLNCRMFLTTRHIEKLEYIPSSLKTMIDIDNGFSTQESLELFTKAFDEPLPADMPHRVKEFHDICNGHPFIMSLIAKTFQNFKENQKSREERCDKWLKNLGEYELQDKDDQIKMSVEESLKFLNPYHQVCYKKMVIFTDNADIPFKVLNKIWDTDSHQTEDIVLKFHKYSLIERPISEENDKACSLHYLHFHFLKQHVAKHEQQDYHRHLVDKYGVQQIFKERKELDLDFSNDNYFHYFIPYHLVGAKMEDLFDLYLDYGFLEQKMRITKLPNTVGDLIRFESQITRNDRDRTKFLYELIDFLTNSEQLIFKSEDVNLLQCALTSNGLVQKEALSQMAKYQDRVWMDDLNHGENQTQIVQLPGSSQPQLVRFVKPNDNLVCLISLQDNHILLHDISQDYLDDPVFYKNELSNSKITDMQIFRNQAFLTLNDFGKLSVYTLKNSPTRRTSGPSKVHITRNLDPQNDKLLQRIEDRHDKITCFNVFELQHDSAQSQVDLIVGTSQGNIKFYQWKINKFEEIKNLAIPTAFNDLFRMAHILNDYVMLLNSHGDIKFIDLINSGPLGTNCEWNKLETPINLHQGICSHTKRPISICVSMHKVVQVTHEAKRKLPNSGIIFLECEEVFMAEDEFDDNKILSSTMSNDAEYLILGTMKGIIVMDRFDKKVIFRRNVSDHVLSLDIFRYHDEAMYILSSVFKDAGHIISLYGFNGNRDELAVMRNEMNFLVGDDLFDVIKLSNEWQIVAVDSKRNIHFRSCLDDFIDSSFKTPFSYQIKKLSVVGERIIVGCTNGSVYSTNQYNQKTLLTNLMSEITYLECIDDAIVASCNSSFKIVGIEKEFYGKVTKAYRYKDNQLLLVKKNCAIEIMDSKTGNVLMVKFPHFFADDTCSTQAYFDNMLVIATMRNMVYVCNVDIDDPETVLDLKPFELDTLVTSLAISADKNVLAIGCHDGNIEIFDLTRMTSIQRLESHKRPIMNLKFSPWTEPYDPLILLSLSESIVFWNIRSIQNSSLNSKKTETPGRRVRVSQRFKSPLKIAALDPNFLSATENLTLKEVNPWSKKTGAADKPELLSCIKLVAKSAKRIICNDEFNRFVTIDNEGNIYHLRLIREESENQITIDFNGNPMQ